MIQHPAPFRAGDADVLALQQAISAIARCGYCETNIAARLGLDDLGELNWRHLPIYRAEKLTARDPLDLAIELLLLQRTLTSDELEKLPSGLVASGILEDDDAGGMRAKVSLFPVDGRLLLADHAWPELSNRKVAHDHVMAIGRDSRHLARCTMRRPVGAALDLCTGSGVQAILAAAHAHTVLAVDINPRAVSYTKLNAEVLGISNLEAVEGDLYAPAGSRQFDLITANPPFVPSPVHAVGFRDGGASGEDVQRRIVAGLPRYLAPGGIAHMITEVGERGEQEPITHRLRQWVEGAPIDIHVLRLATFTAAQYAIGHAQGDDYPAFLASCGEWNRNLREQGYTKIHSVVVSFQWTETGGEAWEREDSCPAPRTAAGEEILAIFEAERLARMEELRPYLGPKHVRRSGPVARFDARILGDPQHHRATATRLGQALKIEHVLDNFEQQVLEGLAGPAGVAGLFVLATQFGVTEDQLLAALRGLLRKRLISVD